MEQKTLFHVKKNNNFYLDNSDYQVLSLLYKPIIGVEALNLYLTLYYMSIEKGEYYETFLYLADSLSIDTVTKEEIEECLIVLSRFKLLKKLNTNDFTIYPPLSAGEYFSSILITYLKERVSNKEFDFIKDVYLNQKIAPEINEHVTEDDVEKNITYKIRKGDKIIFDFILFKGHAKDSGFTILMEDSEFFTSLAKLFTISLNDMLSLLFETAEDDNTYIKRKLIDKAYQKFQKKQEKEDRQITLGKNDEECISYIKKTLPEDILKSTLSRVSRADASIIQRLRDGLFLSNELISLIVAYSISQHNKLQSYNYFEKIVLDWKDKSITTVEEAYAYITEKYTKTQSKSISKVTDMDSAREWFDDYWDKIVKEAKDEKDK